MNNGAGTGEPVGFADATGAFEGRLLRQALPISRIASRSLQEGKSIIVSGPRHFNVEQIALEAVGRVYGTHPNLRIVRLTAGTDRPGGKSAFSAIWQETAKQLGIVSKIDCSDPEAYVSMTLKHLRRPKQPLTVFMLRGGTRTSAQYYKELIDAIHKVIDGTAMSNGSNNNIFVAIDDFSLYYLIRDSDTLGEDWFRAQWLQFGHLTKEELTDCCEAWFGGSSEAVPDTLGAIADQLFACTDGHYGLIEEFFHHLAAGAILPIDSLAQGGAAFVERAFVRSAVLERIRSALSDDALGLCKTAIEHRSPKMPTEYHSPQNQILRQLGILRWDNSYEAKMCHGVIRSMVEAVASQGRKSRLGSITGMAGISRFEDVEFVARDSDIVVVHVSDIHFGADFAYKFGVAGRTHNESQMKIADLLRNDIALQNLTGRIDALIVSGDIVCSGRADEFSRAAEGLQEIIAALGISPENIIIVPGNHDLDWNPGDFARREPGRNVSREDYDNFYSALMGRKPQPAELSTIQSRDGAYRLSIVALDSNEVEGRESAGIGFIGEKCFSEARKLLSERAEHPPGVEARTWCVMHHHLVAVTSTSLADARDRGRVSVLANAPALLSFTRDFGIEVVLHGHEHQPAVTELKWWLGEQGSRLASVAAICAGSLAAKRERLGPVSQNHYMVLVRRPDELIVRSRMMGEQGLGFRTHEDLSLALLKTL